MATMDSPMLDRPEHRPNRSEVAFIVGVTIAAIGLIVVSLMLGVASDPDNVLSIFGSP
jgi:hypothetical protein